jgi:uronate dehydrogenase
LTGAAGRVGRMLRPLLRETYDLRLCDLMPMEALSPDEEIVQGDLSDSEVARAAAEGVSGVIHLAGLVASEVSFEDTLDPNYRIVLRLLEACRRFGVTRFVFGSSHHIVGLNRPGAETPIAPDGFYGLSKAFGEAACALYAHRFGISCLIVRIGNADPEVLDGRRERLWVSGRDLAHLITIGLDHPALGCEIVYGTSNCPDPIFSNETAFRLGYRPMDHASDHRSAMFRPLTEMEESEGPAYIGGFFAATALPDPFA